MFFDDGSVVVDVPDRVTTLETQVGDLRSDVVALRQEMRTGFAGVNTRLDAMVTRDDPAASRFATRDDLATLRMEMRDDLATLRMEMRDDLAALRTEMRVLHEDVIERIKTLGEALDGGRPRRKPR